MTEFNSVCSDLEPQRNVPSILMSHLYRPRVDLKKPTWHALVNQFALGDQEYLVSLYDVNPQAAHFTLVRYDQFDATPNGKTAASTIQIN